MYPCVLRAAARTSIVIRSAPGIDRRGLHVTNCEALGDALARLEPGPETICLVDGFRLPRCEVPHRRVVGGDRTSAAIAAASVLAKVTRDRYMREAAERHPGWGFEEHVGYSTPEHRAAIDELGISPLHRRSFASVAYTQLGLDGGYRRRSSDRRGCLSRGAGASRRHRRGARGRRLRRRGRGRRRRRRSGSRRSAGLSPPRAARPSRRWRGAAPGLLARRDPEDRALGADPAARRGPPSPRRRRGRGARSKATRSSSPYLVRALRARIR